MLECLLGARVYGIEKTILASASRSLNKPLVDTVNSLLTTDVIHACRSSEEADMSADTLTDAGIEPLVTRNTAARLPRGGGAGDEGRRQRLISTAQCL